MHDLVTAAIILIAGFGFYRLFATPITGTTTPATAGRTTPADTDAEPSADRFREGDPSDAPDFAGDIDIAVLHKLWIDGFASGCVSAIGNSGGDPQLGHHLATRLTDAINKDPAVVMAIEQFIRERIANPNSRGGCRQIKLFTSEGGH